MNTTELTSTEINRLVANAAGYFVDEEGDLCYLYTQEQRDAATTAEERLVNLIASAAIDIAAIDVRAIQSTLGVSRVPADFERTIGRKLDSIQEQAEELAETTSTEISGIALEFTTDSSEVDGMNGQEWAGLVNEALAAAYPAVTFCDPNDLNLLAAGSGRPDVSDQINYDRFTECGADELQELAAKPVHLAALTIAAELVDIPDAHRGGIYAFNAWTGEGGEWYSAGTVLPAGAVGVPARQHDWSDYDRDEALEAINQLHDLEGLIAEARSAADD